MWLPPTPRMLWVVRCHEGGGVVVGARAVWRWSAAQGLRALGCFVDAGWQDLRAVHDSRGPCSEKGPFLARSSRGVSSDGDLRGFSDTWRAHLAKASSFWMHGARILPRSPPFLVRGPFWDTWSEKIATDCRPGTHQGAILPSPGARERISRVFAISERPQRHSAMCLNVLRRSPIDARAERPTHALRARCSCPRAARHSAAMPCAVRGAFVAAEKVSCGLRVSMR